MARLQDFQNVTPTDSDKLLVVQSQGQGLATFGSTIGAKMDKANPTGTGSLSLNRKANTTTGTESTTLGRNNEASGSFSVAEGASNTASGEQSHVEGFTSVASGSLTHAEGLGTIAQRKSQHVFGEYNVADTGGSGTTTKGTYIEIVGKGTADNARSNARTLDWSGNEVLAGDLTINGNMSVGNAIGGIKRYELNNGHPITIATGSYSAFLILGFVQGVGSVNVLLRNNNNTIAAYDILSGNAFSSTYLTFTLASGQLKIESPQALYSYLTIIGGGLNISL